MFSLPTYEELCREVEKLKLEVQQLKEAAAKRAYKKTTAQQQNRT
jgi:hypothetical protein